MPAGFTRAEANAKDFGDEFTIAGLLIANSALTTAQTTVAVAHGLGAAPTFVLVKGTTASSISWTAGATTITFTSTETNAPETISYLAAILS